MQHDSKTHLRLQPASPVAQVKDPAASMSLIFDNIRHPLDPLYSDYAARRQREGREPAKVSTPLSVIVMLLIGLLLGAGAMALRQPAKVVESRHNQLVTQIEQRQKSNDDVVRDIESLRAEVATLQSAALGRTSKDSLAKDLDRARAEAAATPVSGPGMTLTLDNPSDGDPNADSDPRTTSSKDAISSTDIQQVVNALKASGAKGIAINDQRLSTVSAIRFAGSAVLVNYRPLTTPYRISAVGDGDLRSRFYAGYGGKYVDGLRKSGFQVSATSGTVSLPASPNLKIAHATVSR